MAEKKKKPPGAAAKWMISTSAETEQDFQSVVKGLKSAGLSIENEKTDVMPTIGTICGSAPREHRAKLKKVPMVVDVEEQANYQLPPPESPVQ
jgi:hypothetical protein